jgi:hypothetical protein
MHRDKWMERQSSLKDILQDVNVSQPLTQNHKIRYHDWAKLLFSTLLFSKSDCLLRTVLHLLAHTDRDSMYRKLKKIESPKEY